MNKIRRPIPWLSGSLATLVALVVIEANLPNTDRAIVDHTFNPPHVYVQPQPWVVCYILALALAPVFCIFILSRRWEFFEWLGWGLLAFLIVSMIAR
jgi:hypothetical protein